MKKISDSTDTVQIGKRIKAQRKLRGLSQAQLAEKISLTPHYISEIECGRRHASTDTMFGIASALQISLDYLYWGSESEKPDTAEMLQLIEQCSPEDLKRLEIIARSLLAYSNADDT